MPVNIAISVTTAAASLASSASGAAARARRRILGREPNGVARGARVGPAERRAGCCRPPRSSGARKSATWSNERARARNEPSTSEPPSTIRLQRPCARRAPAAPTRAPTRPARAGRVEDASRRAPRAPRAAGGAPHRESRSRRAPRRRAARAGSPSGSRRRESSTTRWKGRRVRGAGSSSGSSASDGADADQHAVVQAPQARAASPALGGARDPLRFAARGGDAAVEGRARPSAARTAGRGARPMTKRSLSARGLGARERRP